MRATYRHRRERHYRRPGGPWQVGTLDDVLAPMSGVAEVAGGLRRAGVRRGDVVAWQLPNIDDAALLYRACWRLGAVAAPVHHLAGEAEVRERLAPLDPKVVIGAGEAPPRSADAPVARDRARPSDVAVVLFTSGSSGRPKAVLHTHRGLAYKARLMAAVHGLGSDDAVLMPAPLAHISGLLNGVLVPGAAGMRAVLMARWDPEHALRIIQRERISFMIGPPTFFLDLLGAASFTREAVASLRLVSSGGTGVSAAFVERAGAELDCVVKRTYGSTEAPTVTTSHAGDDPAQARRTDGRPTGEVELRLGDGDELLVRGPELFVGYTDTDATAAAFAPGGWFRTGDAARLDDGWLTVTGRLGDVIIRGGENVACAEVEAALEAHPAVRQAVAVGVPDPRLGERVAAVVVVAGAAGFDVETARRWFDQQGLARFKAPERVAVVDAIPTLAAGKPDRAALRARLSM